MAIAAALAAPLIAAGGAVELLELRGLDGQTSYINTRDVSSLRQPTSADLQRHFVAGARCIVMMTGGKFIAVTETCTSIRDRMTKTGGQPRP